MEELTKQLQSLDDKYVLGYRMGQTVVLEQLKEDLRKKFIRLDNSCDRNTARGYNLAIQDCLREVILALGKKEKDYETRLYDISQEIG